MPGRASRRPSPPGPGLGISRCADCDVRKVTSTEQEPLTVAESREVEFPLRRPGEPFPPPAYADYRRREGLVSCVLPDGNRVWLVSRHEDVRTVLTCPVISANPEHPGFPNLGATLGVPRQDQVPGWFVGLDPPDHGRFRKALIPEFGARRIRELRPAIQDTVDRLLDEMLAGDAQADLYADFALPVPSLVISAMLGVPTADRDFFESRTRTLMAILASTDEQRETATRELLRYIHRLIAIKQKWPADDLVSRLLAVGTISPAELSGALMLLLIAGHETTADNIALGVVTLLLNPEWIGPEWIGNEGAVEELLRLHSVADLVPLRAAVADVEIAGQLIRAGEGIMPLVAAANHDDEVFACPERFDPSRPARQHVAFGYGMHQCLGANLVRAELEIVFRTLFERIPSLQLATPVEELPFKYNGVIFGLHELPVRW
jgi:cytochrome P450 monooxygenase